MDRVLFEIRFFATVITRTKVHAAFLELGLKLDFRIEGQPSLLLAYRVI